MKAIQELLEDISYLLRIPQRKPYGSMEGDVKKSMKIAMDNKEAILASIPEEHSQAIYLITRREGPWSVLSPASTVYRISKFVS
ncbi:Peptidyl-prolyl cis-trans isomerase CYP37, chloroplastic [Zea mays]|uniref:Peptidyl-prolyl cis-trans isomerase CYP37, chloroplastic n=1 Tax=Zea mays TaxID=4577 RepID=A0A3L6G8X5_MAIZE|nr:Peptidyl-prolyl cis-trans isomerase CYP37, chloroplastic [Zea mays]